MLPSRNSRITQMATEITQIDLDDRCRTILRVDGEMLYDDAVLLEKIVVQIRADTMNQIVVDLADLDFLDSDAASVLKRLEDMALCEIEGVEIFLQSAIDMAERS